MLKKSIAVLVLIAALATSALYLFGSISSTAYSETIYAENGIALRGYDPVAYFTDKSPTKGSAEHSLEWRGATWHFASAENRDKFDEDPEKYTPQYGGYCAWAVAVKGQAYAIDPTAWRVVNDKLYLNFSHDIQSKWEKDIPGFIADGDKKWPELKKDLALRGS